MMYTMPKNLLSICVNFALATQHFLRILWLMSISDRAGGKGTAKFITQVIHAYCGN